MHLPVAAVYDRRRSCRRQRYIARMRCLCRKFFVSEATAFSSSVAKVTNRVTSMWSKRSGTQSSGSNRSSWSKRVDSAAQSCASSTRLLKNTATINSSSVHRTSTASATGLLAKVLIPSNVRSGCSLRVDCCHAIASRLAVALREGWLASAEALPERRIKREAKHFIRRGTI
jgi:hypothetical protein